MKSEDPRVLIHQKREANGGINITIRLAVSDEHEQTLLQELGWKLLDVTRLDANTYLMLTFGRTEKCLSNEVAYGI